MKMPFLARAVIRSVLTLACVAALAIAFGGPRQPAPVASINDPFKASDYSDIPAVKRYKCRDGAELAFREYAPGREPPKGAVVLIHGSAARSNSMHVMAKAFSQAGYSTYSLDVRGHGDSGPKGHIAYIGQLEDDLEDFVSSISAPKGATLIGFSSGGGFVLRFAGSERQKLFANYLLLSPFISQDAPTYKPNSGGWVSVGLPRTIAISVLNGIGVTAFNDLPVINFALNEKARSFLTPQYSFALMQNFRPRNDYRADIRSASQPMEVLAGQDDEVFRAERFASVFAVEGKSVPVTLIPKIGHIPLTLDPVATQAAVSAVERLNARSNIAAVALAAKNARIARALLAHERRFESDYVATPPAT
jgi:alpha-beta hydrolase superfamily lysophospholipase